MFGKAEAAGWGESGSSDGSLKSSCPSGHYLGPKGECFSYQPTFEAKKEKAKITCPPGHYLGPKGECFSYQPTFEAKKPFSLWPLILGAFLISQQ